MVCGFGEGTDGAFAEVGEEGFAEGPLDDVLEGFVEEVGEERDDREAELVGS